MTRSGFKAFERQLAANLSPTGGRGRKYIVPGLWQTGVKKTAARKAVCVDTRDYYLNALHAIMRQRATKISGGPGGTWTRDAVIYNMFVRSTCAFDHDGNGKLDLPLNKDGWRETGTFLKALALLPYVKSLGANTIHLLPVTSIGSDGNKGTLGSPYAIKNPYTLDPNLNEPKAMLNVDEEFRWFVQAAHHLGMRVVVEFVFRTSSKDGDWVKEHPEWYYWITADVEDREPGSFDEGKYGTPIFTQDELREIKGKVEHHDFSNLPPPHRSYLDMFTSPPRIEQVKLEGGRYIGTLDDGTRVRIPGAFADWPPDDSQPPWSDVTYLKMYDHPDFNYIAYNTIRMYDSRLARMENINRPLWEKIAGIIPHYQRDFGIDGVMIDMGHALPMELKHEMIRRARSIDPDFAFWDENFSVTARSVEEGYNAVIGYQWADQHHPQKFKAMLRQFQNGGFPLPFFATPESHNTPRAASRDGGITYARYAWAIGNFIPAIPFIHSGFEVGEPFPVNTGLDFTKEELTRLPSETLPLFSDGSYSWLNAKEFTAWVRTVSLVRRKYRSLIVRPEPETFHWIEGEPPEIIAFVRKSVQEKSKLLVVGNSNLHQPSQYAITIETRKRKLIDLLSGSTCSVVDGIVAGQLKPGEVIVCKI